MADPDADSEANTGRQARRRLFEREVTRLMDRLYGTALRLARDPDDAEDITAETIERAWRNIDQLRDCRNLEGWLFQILNNTFVSVWRRRSSRPDMTPDVELSESDGASEAAFSLYQQLHQPFLLWWSTPEQAFINGLLAQDIERAVDALPDAFRIVLVLIEIQGHRYEEVAELLGVPLGTVRSRLNRARGLLQKALWEHAREAGLVHGTADGGPGQSGRRGR